MRAPSIGEVPPSTQVFTSSGEPVDLSSTWSDGPVALVFLRHYG